VAPAEATALPDAFEPIDVAVVGGGISGLASAFWLKQQGLTVLLFESSERVGGCITSIRSSPYIADGGPQSFLPSEPMQRLIEDARLEPLVLQSSPNAGRPYLYARGRLVAVPQSPPSVLATSLISPLAKMRLFGELFVPRKRTSDDESVAGFVRRRAGAAVLDAMVGPYVSGIFAGDPEKLSVQSAFPMMTALERDHGGLIRGAIARMKQNKRNNAAGSAPRSRRRSFGFRGGNDVLPWSLAQRLGSDVRLNSPVRAMWQRGNWMEMLVGGKTDTRVIAKSIVLAVPSAAAADLLEPLEPQAATALREIEYPSVAQIALAYPREAIGVPLDGFGFLAPRREGLTILGCVWNSVMFEDRAPHDEVLLTAFAGGATNPEAADKGDEELTKAVHADLRKAMKIKDGVTPRVVAGFRWQEAIPQYAVGHRQRLATIHAGLERLPHVRLSGSYLRGPSVPECIASARQTADDVIGATSEVRRRPSDG
jgi:oxygen-dependent protoporphyrinogen oxidase